MKMLLILPMVLMALPAMAQERKCAEIPECSKAYANDFAAAEALKNALKTNDRMAVAQLFYYPIQRNFPQKAITNSDEMVLHWDEFFDAASIRAILAIEPEEVGWRGIAILGQGANVWFNHGKITVHADTQAAKQAVVLARKTESDTLYRSAQGYDKVDMICRTDEAYVRAQYHGRDARLFVWKKGDALSDKPKLELRGGKVMDTASGGSYKLVFDDGTYRHVLEHTGVCGEDCNDYFVVYDGDKEVTRWACVEGGA